jgi:hypothetical protein
VYCVAGGKYIADKYATVVKVNLKTAWVRLDAAPDATPDPVKLPFWCMKKEHGGPAAPTTCKHLEWAIERVRAVPVADLVAAALDVGGTPPILACEAEAIRDAIVDAMVNRIGGKP